MNIITVPVGPIQKNRAQMRRKYDLVKLSELTLQMLTRGFDGDKPLLIRQSEGAGYENIRGHRRRMAFLMAQSLLAQGGEWAIEKVLDSWNLTVRLHNGDVEAAAESLVAEHGHHEVPAVLFEGDAQQAVLALWSDNYGDEDPDPLGVAHSLMVGVALGIKPDVAASHMGQSSNYVRNHLALAQVDPEIARRIADGELSMTMAPLLMELSDHRREALSQFILMTPSHAVTVANVRRMVRHLKEFKFEVPLTVPHSARRNIARAFSNLWVEALEQNPVRAYLGVCTVLFFREDIPLPWEVTDTTQTWLQALGVDVPGHWSKALEPYLKEVSCANCPIAQLPDRLLKVDLISPSLPCRHRDHRGKVDLCLHGLAPFDPFHMRVPMAWAGHPGVQQHGGMCYVTSYEDLLAAWNKQAEDEDKAEAKEKAVAKRQEKAEAKAAATAPPASASAPTPTPAAPAQPEGPSPITIMRAKIALYMNTHGDMNGGHLLATPCAHCQHRLESSPTSDPSVPHCAWATHQRQINFDRLAATNGYALPPIGVCSQFAPNRPWREIVPAHPDPGQMPRAWLVEQIRLLAKDRASSNNYKPFQWLTGRPMSSSQNWDDWFLKQFEEQQGDLSDAQIYTLFILVHSEWKRSARWGDDGVFFIPVDNNFGQMIPVKAEKWEMSNNE